MTTATRHAAALVTLLAILWSPLCQAAPKDVTNEAESARGIPLSRARIVVDRETSGSRSFIVIKISVPTDSTITAFAVVNPARIVIDFEGTRTKRNEVLSVPTNPIVRQIRLGAHPEKLRVVLDLFRSAPEDFDHDISPRQIVLRLPESSDASISTDTTGTTDKKMPLEAAHSPVPTIAITATTKPSEPEPTNLPVSTRVVVKEETPIAVPTSTPKATNTSEAIPTLVASPSPTATTYPTVTPSAVQTELVAVTPLAAKSATAIKTATTTKTATPTKTVKVTETPAPTKTPTPTATASNTPTATKTATATRTLIPSLTPTPKAQPSPTNVPGFDGKKVLPMPAGTSTSSLVGDVSIASPPVAQGGKLLVMGYRFDYLNPGKIPILKVNLLRAKAQAQISKVDTKTYRIVIPNCGLVAAQLALPQFPPADFIGFSMVAAQELEGRVEITVTVEPGVTLGTFVRDNEIWVKRL